MEDSKNKKPSSAKATAGEAEEIKEQFNFKGLKATYYFEAVGKRKTARARIRLYIKGDKKIIVNDKDYTDYFPTPELQGIVLSALEKMEAIGRFTISVKASGGGLHAQAEALRHGISKALVDVNADFRKKLRRAGYLTRDPRARERKKPGLKRARKAPQWSKR